ncbi:MAG TPA: hypothetical protein VHO06_08650, partial [Polyangia bacterium]|nr:hypothetical protein [Polyangia bacterium]
GGGGSGGSGGSSGSGGSGGMVTIGGTVSGLAGAGLVLSDNGGDNLTVSANGAFTFNGKLAAGAAFQVTVATQPTAPSQTCVVSGGSGTASQDVTTVAVTCMTNSYRVGGMVSGLSGTGLVLQDNGGDNLSVSADGSFSFATAVASGATFTVTIHAQPTGPQQTCTVSGGSGTVAAGDVTSVMVNCSTQAFAVGGTVSGLAGTGLVLQDNGGDDLAIGANGSFAFATAVASGGAFAVTVKTQPSSPAQTCVVAGGAGAVANAAVSTVTVTCTTDTHTVGGTVSGLAGTGLVLQDNLGDNLSLSTNGAFTFATPLASGSAYAVTVLSQPASPSQTCTVATGSGSIGAADVKGVAVTCVTNTYAVGGTVVGLLGQGLVLQDNAGDDLQVTANGAFTFATSVASGGAFAVTVATQPSGPTQSCSVSGGSGTVGAGAVTSVVVNCATDQYVIGGDVSGLVGGGLALALNGGTALAVGADGTFAFPDTVASGGAYAVTVVAQPTAPSQTCTVAGGSGTVAAANVSSVHVTCTTDTHTIGGTVSGLAGTGLVLQDNAGDDLTVGSNGAFTFATAVASGQGYLVTVATQPTSPLQTCTVTAGSGGVSNADVTSVVVQCVTNVYTVGGTVTGLAGTLQLLDGSDPLTVTANGMFTFPTAVPSGGAYAVSVSAQPSSPSQTCTVTGGTGSVVDGDITTVAITCVTNNFNVGGTVTGLLGTGLVLEDNGGDDLTVNMNGTFQFATQVTSGQPYAVTIKTQPGAPSQTCTLAGASGTVGAADVGSVSINCSTNAFAVGGTVSGLLGTGLVLTNNLGDDLTVSSNGSFSFATPVPSGGAYAVAVKTQPTSPSQTCSVTGGSGSVSSSAITTVAVSCTTNTYNVSVTVSGLAGSGLVLQDNGADNLAVSASGTFAFATAVASGQTYAVTVLSQPTMPWQTCAVASPSGVMAGAAVNLAVTCTTNVYTVSVTTSGLAGTGLVLQDNGGDNLAVSANGTLTFATSVASGAGYAVTVKTQPSGPSQTCTVTNGTGAIANANVTNVAVACATNTYAVGGTVSGLAGTGLVLQDNGGDNLTISANGSFTFATQVASGAGYAVSIKTQPTGPSQTCTLSGASGTIGAAAVTSVVVNCATNTYTVGGSVSGLAGTGLVLQDNGGDNLTISANGSFAFATALSSGATYAVTVKTQPTSKSQTCTVTSGSGTVGGANVTSVAVACVTNTYTVSAAVSGLSGTVVLQDNGGDNLSVTASGTSAFATKIASGATYSVSVLTQPATQTCTVTAPTGTIAAANVTVTVTCVTNTYSIGGSVSGLTGAGLVLQDNGGDNLAVSASGTFTFVTKIAAGSTYAVSVGTQPAGQLCSVTSGSGTVGGANVTNVSVTCSNASVQILVDCASNSRVLNTFTGTGCFSPIAAGGASYIIMSGTPTARLWSGANCTGCSYTVTADLNFCSASFTGGCGGLNDNVQSISIP